MKTSAAKPKASAGSSSGDMNSRSNSRAAALRERAIASEAAVPRTAEIAVVQNATTRLVQAARCIWSGSSSALYEGGERPSGGTRSDCEAVSEVSSTIRLGPMRNTTATAVSAANVKRSERLSQSTNALRFNMGGRDPCEQVEKVNHRQH